MRPQGRRQKIAALALLVIVGVFMLTTVGRSDLAPRSFVKSSTLYDWKRDDHRGLLVRAGQSLALNREAFNEADARMMTVINLAEANGFVRMIGPIYRAKAGDPWPVGTLYVGNANGTVDVTGWQLNGVDEKVTLAGAVKRARMLHQARGWQPWVAWRSRATNVDWPLFVAIVDEAARLSTMPARWVEAAQRRKN